MAHNPFFIKEESVISFSGGRTSAYMLWLILEAHGGKLPDYVKVVFANTGKEMQQTLDFVRDCGEAWDVEIAWVERYMRLGSEEEKNKYYYDLKVVDYETASRDGAPFFSLANRPYLPNPVQRFCTSELKVRAIKEYLKVHCGFETPYQAILGIRADEERRAAKMISHPEDDGQERYLPLYLAGITKEDVYDFWSTRDYDLKLPNNNGTTDWGNCDLCYLKGVNKKLTIISQAPHLVDWWISMEDKVGARFRNDHPTYRELKVIASDQPDMFIDDVLNTSIDCFCGE